jgi:nucleotide-binding universal stress UspA family protein
MEGLDPLRTIAHQRLSDMLVRAGGPGGVTMTAGHPSDAIVQKPERIDPGLVVVGTQGSSGLARITIAALPNPSLIGRPARCSSYD